MDGGPIEAEIAAAALAVAAAVSAAAAIIGEICFLCWKLSEVVEDVIDELTNGTSLVGVSIAASCSWASCCFSKAGLE